MQQAALRRLIPFMVVLALVLMILGYAGVVLAFRQGIIAPFSTQMHLCTHGVLALRHGQACMPGEFQNSCHYRAGTHRAISLVYRAPQSLRTVLLMPLPDPGDL